MDFSRPFFQEIEELKSRAQFLEAETRFRKALQNDPADFTSLYIWACMAFTQGLVGDGLELLARCKAICKDRGVDSSTLALVDMNMINHEPYAYGRSADYVPAAVEIFNQQLHGRAVEDYDETAVNTLCSYLDFCGSLQLSDDDMHLSGPNMGKDFFFALYRRLMGQKSYTPAYFVAQFAEYDYERTGRQIMSELVQDMASHDAIPDYLRARCLEMQANNMTGIELAQHRHNLLEESIRLYRSIGNVPRANKIYVELMTEKVDRSNISTVTNEFLTIHKTAEQYGSWLHSILALQAAEDIYYKACLRIPPDTMAELEKRLLGLFEKCQLGPAQALIMGAKIVRWTQTDQHRGKVLSSLEALYQQAKDFKRTSLISMCEHTLSEIYEQIGQPEKARQCALDRTKDMPRSLRVLRMIDDFSQELKNTDSFPDQDAAYDRLCREIEEAERVVKTVESLEQRKNEVYRLSTFAVAYQRIKLHDSKFAHERFVRKCNDSVRDLCQYLSAQHTPQMLYSVLQNEAALARTHSPSDGDLAKYAATIDRALEIYKECGQNAYCQQTPFVQAINHSQIAGCYHSRWRLAGKPQESEDIVAALTILEEAAGISRRHGYSTQLSGFLADLVDLWYTAFENRVKLPGRQSTVELFRCAVEIEELNTARRLDMSALPSAQALIAIRESRANKVIQGVHIKTVLVFGTFGLWLDLWQWIQVNKSRGVSDKLALGVTLPQSLAAQVESQEDLRQQLNRESELVGQAETTRGPAIAVREQLEAHRASMRQDPVLREVLELREGRMTTLEDLREVTDRAQTSTKNTKRRVLFVDWYIVSGHINCLIGSSCDDDVTHAKTSMSEADIQTWKASYFQQHEGYGEHQLDVNGEEALQKLTPLVEPLVEFSAEADLLVLCPAGILHGLPLHAVFIHSGSSTSLIERNPVVYTSSMTTFEFCASRQLGRQSHETANAAASFVAVFESLEDGSLDEAGSAYRDDIYASVEKISKNVCNSSATLGRDATRKGVAEALTADFVYFFGHCSFEKQNYLEQSLTLAPQEATDQGELRFTAADIFDTKIQASNVMLMACGSAVESHSKGDEPLGLVTALLCAGASSVTGTLWKVNAHAALAFTTAFHVALERERRRSAGFDVLDLARVVQATICRLKKRPATSSVLHWAPFVLHGSWFMLNPS